MSSWSFAAGYFGGFVTLIVGFTLLANAEALGISVGTAARLCFLIAGIWWGGFAIVTLVLLKKRQTDPRGARR